jgi:hypothetical protein
MYLSYSKIKNFLKSQIRKIAVVSKPTLSPSPSPLKKPHQKTSNFPPPPHDFLFFFILDLLGGWEASLNPFNFKITFSFASSVYLPSFSPKGFAHLTPLPLYCSPDMFSLSI